MSAPETTPRARGRLRSRAVSPDAVLAVLLPLACAGALVLVRPDVVASGSHDPVRSELTTASLVCPGAMSPGRAEADRIGVTTLAGGPEQQPRGEVEVRLGGDARSVPVRGGRVTAVQPGAGPVVVTGAGALAPALVAGRSGLAPLVATACAPTASEQWFTAVGAGATHGSVVELVNPNPGAAVADVSVWSPNGPLDATGLRGITVPGDSSARLDLAELAPRRGELTVQVTTLRGQLSAAVLDTYDELGGGVRATEWLPGQGAPTEDSLLLGLARGPGERTLVLGNPGESELRAEIKVVTPRAVFSPAGVEPVRVAPGTTQKVTLSSLLEEVADQGAIGVVVTANGPLTATMRQFVDGDLSLLGPAEPVSSATAVVLPEGRKRLLLADPGSVGVATVTALAADGDRLFSKKLDLEPGTGANIELPTGADLVVLSPEQTTVRAAVLVVADGSAAVRMRELPRTGLVPHVRPALP